MVVLFVNRSRVEIKVELICELCFLDALGRRGCAGFLYLWLFRIGCIESEINLVLWLLVLLRCIIEFQLLGYRTLLINGLAYCATPLGNFICWNIFHECELRLAALIDDGFSHSVGRG